MRTNKKLVVLGLAIVVLGLWINSMLGYQGDYPTAYEESIEYVNE